MYLDGKEPVMNKVRNGKLWATAGTAILFMVIMIVMFHTNVRAEENDTIPENVYIGEVNVGGMTAEDAESAVSAYVDELQDTDIVLKGEKGQLEVTAEDLGLEWSSTEAVDEAMNIGQVGNLISRYKDMKDLENGTKVLPLGFSVDEEKTTELLEEAQSDLEDEAVDYGLSLENGVFTVIDGKAGVDIDIDASIDEITTFLNEEWSGDNTEIELVTMEVQPKGSAEELSKVQDLLGSCSTDYSSSNSGRAKNVANGASKINGTVVYPGEQFSVYEAVSPFSEENGYALAGSYENGTVVETYGGGICQVSTTLYNAVLKAELQVDQRFAHSMIVSYVEPSMDAAIAGTYKDLKFTNNTDAPIYIEGYTSGGYIYFNIYGEETRDSGRVVSYESEVTSQTDPGLEVVTSSEAVGTVTTEQSAHVGKTARLWKIITENGVEVSREVINNSTYKVSNKIISVGITSESAEAVAAMQAAIATNDEATIRAAAAQWAGATSSSTTTTTDQTTQTPATGATTDNTTGTTTDNTTGTTTDNTTGTTTDQTPTTP